jgi:hypothetical protein
MGTAWVYEHAEVYKRVWPHGSPDQSHEAMREALVRMAVEITHECGTEESTFEACAETIRDFLDHELMHACGISPTRREGSR